MNEPNAAVVQRVLPASPDVVYDEWLDAEGLTEWMCPRPAMPVKVELEPKVGGRLRIDVADQGYQVQITGTYLDLDRPRRLSFTWKASAWDASAPDSVVTVLLEPRGDGHTLMTIRHALLPEGVAERHERGWLLVARQLDDILLAR